MSPLRPPRQVIRHCAPVLAVLLPVISLIPAQSFAQFSKEHYAYLLILHITGADLTTVATSPLRTFVSGGFTKL